MVRAVRGQTEPTTLVGFVCDRVDKGAVWVFTALPVCSLPGAEITLLIQALIQALTGMQQTSVLHHPRVTVSGSRTPPRLVPA